MPGWPSGWRRWNGPWAATAGTPRCRRRPMICPGGRSRPGGGRRGPGGRGASSRARRAAPWRGCATPTSAWLIDPRGPAAAGPTWPAGPRWASSARIRSMTCPRSGSGCGREHVADRPAQVPVASCSYGPTIRSLVVYLLIYQHVPVARCVELIADLTGGTAPSTGFCHGLLARCATAVRQTVTTIKSLITVAHVVGFDETTLRAGPAGQKRHVLSAVTDQYSLFHLGGRDLASFRTFGIL